MKWIINTNETIELYLRKDDESYFRHSSGAEFVSLGDECTENMIEEFDSGNFSIMDSCVEEHLWMTRDISEEEMIDIESFWPTEQKINLDFVIASVLNNRDKLVISEPFKNLCSKIISEIGGEIQGYIDPGYPSNFIAVAFDVRKEGYLLLCNYTTNHLAFAKKEVQTLEPYHSFINWIDFPEPAAAFNDHFKVLSVAELKAPTIIKGNDRSGYYLENDFYYSNCPYMLNGLSYNLGYWRPETIAEVVFNWFD